MINFQGLMHLNLNSLFTHMHTFSSRNSYQSFIINNNSILFQIQPVRNPIRLKRLMANIKFIYQ